MTVKKLYLASHDLNVDAVVTSVRDVGERLAIRLTQTVFHPQGGGQKADRGTINSLAVDDVRHGENGEVDHFVCGSSFVPGVSVRLMVNATARALGRRWHSGGHLIAEAVRIVEPDLIAAKGHHWPGEARVEFDGVPSGVGTLASRLQDAVKDLIDADLPFELVGDPFSSRTIRIGRGQPVPCGGTHVSSSAQLCGLTIRKAQVKNGLVRIGYDFGSCPSSCSGHHCSVAKP